MAILLRLLGNSELKAEGCGQNMRWDEDSIGLGGRYPQAAAPRSHSKKWNRRVRDRVAKILMIACLGC